MPSAEVLNPAFLTKLAHFAADAISDENDRAIALGNDFSDLYFFSEARRHGLQCQILSVVNNPMARPQWNRHYPNLSPPTFQVPVPGKDLTATLDEHGDALLVPPHDDPVLFTFFLSNHISAAEAALKTLAKKSNVLVGEKTVCVLDFIAVNGKMNRNLESDEQKKFRQLLKTSPRHLSAALYQRILPTLRKISGTLSLTDTLSQVSFFLFIR